MLSAFFLISIMIATLATLPWTFGHEVIEGQPSASRRFEATNPELALQPPSWSGESIYLLGSDHLGRDLLARMLAGGGISLIVGLAAATTAVVLGGLWGMVAATSSPRVDGFMMRIVDVLYGLPYILIVVLLVVAVEGILERSGVVLGSAESQWVNVLTLWIAIGAVSWLTMARVIRGQVLSLRSQPFMEACRAISAMDETGLETSSAQCRWPHRRLRHVDRSHGDAQRGIPELSGNRHPGTASELGKSGGGGIVRDQWGSIALVAARLAMSRSCSRCSR